jgi:hypothetical protein
MVNPNSPQFKALNEGLLVSKAREQFGEQSSQASTSVRALALAIIAVAWLFLLGKNDDPSSALGVAKQEHLLAAAILAGVLSLGLDAMQYGVTTWLWSSYIRVLEKATSIRGLAIDDPQMWEHADKIGLVKYILDETGQNTAILKQRRDLSIDEVKALLSSYFEPNGDPALKEKIWNAFNRPEVPKLALKTNRSFFWLKIASVTVGSGCIVAFIVLRVW